MLREKIQTYSRMEHRRSFYIAELDETVYFTPISLNEMQKILTLSGDAKNSNDFHVFTWIEKLEDANGNKLLDVTAKPFIEANLPWKVVAQVSKMIHELPSVEDLKKNSEKTSIEEISLPLQTGNAVS